MYQPLSRVSLAAVACLSAITRVGSASVLGALALLMLSSHAARAQTPVTFSTGNGAVSGTAITYTLTDNGVAHNNEFGPGKTDGNSFSWTSFSEFTATGNQNLNVNFSAPVPINRLVAGVNSFSSASGQSNIATIATLSISGGTASASDFNIAEEPLNVGANGGNRTYTSAGNVITLTPVGANQAVLFGSTSTKTITHLSLASTGSGASNADAYSFFFGITSSASTPEPCSLSLLCVGMSMGLLGGLALSGILARRGRRQQKDCITLRNLLRLFLFSRTWSERIPFASSSFFLALSASIGIGVGGVGIGGGVARAQRLYVGGDGGQFGILNAVNGNYNSIGITHVGNSSTAVILYGLGYAANGNLYGLSVAARLYQVDAQTASLTLVGNVSGLVNGSTLGATSDGTLYALSKTTPSSSDLYSINPTSAVATLKGPTGFVSDGGISGDGGGNLYVTQGDNGQAFNILNKNTGAGTQISSSAGYGNAYALGYSTTNNTLYALNDSGGIYSVSTATGKATSTGKTYDTSADGAGVILAAVGFRAAGSGATPEPSSLALVALGGLPTLGIVVRRVQWTRRRNQNA